MRRTKNGEKKGCTIAAATTICLGAIKLLVEHGEAPKVYAKLEEIGRDSASSCHDIVGSHFGILVTVLQTSLHSIADVLYVVYCALNASRFLCQ